MKKVYKIWCEWEIGIEDNIYLTKELAQKVINEYDWESYTDYTLKEVQEDGLVSIEEFNLITE